MYIYIYACTCIYIYIYIYIYYLESYQYRQYDNTVFLFSIISRRHTKCIFIYFNLIVSEEGFQRSNWSMVSNGLGNEFTPSRRQSIIRTKNNQIHWRIYASLGLNIKTGGVRVFQNTTDGKEVHVGVTAVLSWADKQQLLWTFRLPHRALPTYHKATKNGVWLIGPWEMCQ